MMQNNRIVPMESRHVPQIAELEQICFPDPWSAESIAGELDNPLSLWLVALDGDTVTGYAGSQAVMDEADIMNIAVAPSCRRCGIAEMLLQELQERLSRTGVHSLTLEVRPSNEAAISLYHKMGYVQVGRRPNYYHKPKEDALILRKEWEL